jgi:hypothetical protein
MLTPPTRAYRPFVQKLSLRAFDPTLTPAIMKRWTVRELMVKLVMRAHTMFRPKQGGVSSDAGEGTRGTRGEKSSWEEGYDQRTFVHIGQKNKQATRLDVGVPCYPEEVVPYVDAWRRARMKAGERGGGERDPVVVGDQSFEHKCCADKETR